MRRLVETNEDYSAYDSNSRKGGNLTPDQQRYNEVWRKMRPMQARGLRWGCMGLGFRSGRISSQAGVSLLSPEHPIQPVTAVRALTIVPIPASQLRSRPKRNDKPVRHAAAYRLNLLDVTGRVDHGDVVFDFAGCGKNFQIDAGRSPLQDRQRYSTRCYNPGSIGGLVAEAANLPPLAAQLLAPHGGAVTTMRDELFFRILIEGHDVFRFSLQDLPGIEMVRTSGLVNAGELLGTLTVPMTFQAAEFYGNASPIVHRISGDTLPASRRRDQLSFVTDALGGMVEYANMLQTGSACDYVTDCESMLPRHLVQFPKHVIERRWNYGWQANPAFNKLMCYYLGPDAKAADGSYLAIRAPVTGILAKVERDNESVRLSFVDHDGRPHGFAVPACAVLGDKAAKVLAEAGDVEVTEGEDLGDFVPRSWYESVAQVADLAGTPGLRKIQSDLFDAMLLRPGQQNWHGEGACVDRSLVPEQMLSQAIGHWLDLSALEPYFDKEYNLYRLPALPYDFDAYGYERTINQIRYDFTPQAGLLQTAAGTSATKATTPGDPSPRKRRRRSSRKSSKS